jgi:hypothetical protein
MMWLLHAKTRRLRQFKDVNDAPPYAILSHTWGDACDEVAFHEIDTDGIEQRRGFEKIRLSCEQAIKDNLEWVWIDRLV